MGTIVERKRANGSIAFLAQIAVSRDGKRAHSESKTFDRRPAAAAWIKLREKELSGPDATLGKPAKSGHTLKDAIQEYIKSSRKKMGKTKAQVLDTIMSHDIADMRCVDIESDHLVKYATFLGGDKQPQTVGNYMSHLSSVFAIAKPAWKMDLNYQAIKDAVIVAKRLGVIGKARQRDRRPTIEEMNKVLTHFENVRLYRPSTNPMVPIIGFAMFSTRRQEEICTIKWKDLDVEGSRILVRDMKNPGDKFGNDVWCDLPPLALRIVQTMPKVADEIFPYSTDAVSAAFTRATEFLQIDDLHFHDLRHEGISCQFELGKNIPHVAAVSGHRSWSSLKRYTHIRQTGDKWAGWEWIERICNHNHMIENPPPRLPPKERKKWGLKNLTWTERKSKMKKAPDTAALTEASGAR